MLPTLLIFSILLLLALLPTMYIDLVLCRNYTLRRTLLCWVPFALFMLLMVSSVWIVHTAFFLHTFIFMVLCVLVPALVLTAVSGIGWLLAHKWPQAFRRGNYVAYVLSAATFVTMCIGIWWGPKQLTVKEVDLYVDNLPEAFDGYRIVQLSDLHVGTFGSNTDFVERVVERTNDLHPDMIVFTGDLVNLRPDEITPFEPVLSRLTAPDGVYSVFGNHDYCQYGFNKDSYKAVKEWSRLWDAETAMGWRVLENDRQAIVRDSSFIVIAGVGNASDPLLYSDARLEKALRRVPDSVFTILLSHNPAHWRMEVLEHSSVDLMLSGHTHAAQFKIGNSSPASITYDEWSGLYEDTIHQTPFSPHRYLYVSEGLGGTFPFRLGTKPEIILITLHKK